jgi:hypothetical protein
MIEKCYLSMFSTISFTGGPYLPSMILIPQRLFESNDVQILLRDGNNCILHKSLTEDVVGREAYVANHVVSFVLEGVQTIRTYDEAVISVKSGEMVLLPRGVYYVTDLRARGDVFKACFSILMRRVFINFFPGSVLGKLPESRSLIS